MSTSVLQNILRENYLIAKIRGEKGLLVKPDQLLTMAGLRTVQEISGALSDTAYGKLLSDENVTSPDKREKALKSEFYRTLYLLMGSGEGKVHEFLEDFSRYLDSRDLAALVLFKSQGKSWDEFENTRHSSKTLRTEKMQRAYSYEGIRSILELLGDRHLVKRVEGLSLEDLEGEKAAFLADTIVAWGSEKLFKYVARELSGLDRATCRPIIGSEVDIRNILIILRSKAIGASNVRSHMILAKWKLDAASIDQLISFQDVTQGLDFLASHYYYGPVFVGARQKFEDTKSLAFLENGLRRHQLKLSRRIFMGFPYSLGIILAYLIYKENEARNVAAILTGVDSSLEPDEIRSLLVAPE